MSDSTIETKAFSLIKELKNGVALANALHARLTDTGCAAAHEQIQSLQAAARALIEAIGTELAGAEHYEQAPGNRARSASAKDVATCDLPRRLELRGTPDSRGEAK